MLQLDDLQVREGRAKDQGVRGEGSGNGSITEGDLKVQSEGIRVGD